MGLLLSLLWLLLAFGAFMALIWSVYAVNRMAARRYGYEPFSLPNAALMLVANLLLLSALRPVAESSSTVGDSGPGIAVMLGAAALIAAGMLVVIARRSNPWYALYAVSLMGVGAIAVLPSLIFMRVATAPGADESSSCGEAADRDA